MNSDICPPGTWSWLHALGYSRADVTRITERRRASFETAVEPAGPDDIPDMWDLPEYLRLDGLQTPEEFLADGLPLKIKPADIEGKELPGGSLSGIWPMSADQHTADVDTLRRHLSNMDAEPMNRDEILMRRTEGLRMHQVHLAAQEWIC